MHQIHLILFHFDILFQNSQLMIQIIQTIGAYKRWHFQSLQIQCDFFATLSRFLRFVVLSAADLHTQKMNSLSIALNVWYPRSMGIPYTKLSLIHVLLSKE